ncbi:MAG: helix-turn-helix transcriptional regulator [Deltaproteobacteria bacterium]|nr:helix-turn-helix transcriptional regulator [Deltaproteobacteria bacterium]
MKSTKILLGARIKELRKSRAMSQEQLAEKIVVDPKHLSRIEVGRGFPSLDALENIANVLGVEMKELFEFQHLDSADSVANAVDSFLESATENEMRILLKLLRALVK